MISQMNTQELIALVPKIQAIAVQASAAILQIYETDFSVENKDDNSPLTAADMAAHKIICAGLQALAPNIPVLSEESAKISFAERQGWEQYWLIDPLDGTREFIKRNGEFSVNIAFIHKHQSILGVIHIPVSGVCYSGVRNHGAFIEEQNKPPRAIAVKKTMAHDLTVVASRSHGHPQQIAFLERLHQPTTFSIGSSLKLCLVAEGKADIYPRFGPTSEWDTAAAQAIVEAAGGMVVDMNFKRLEYNTKDSLLNPEFLVIADPDFDWQQYL